MPLPQWRPHGRGVKCEIPGLASSFLPLCNLGRLCCARTLIVSASALRRTAHLQGPISNTEPPCGAVHVSVLVSERNLDGRVRNGLIDLSQSEALCDGTANRAIKGAI